MAAVRGPSGEVVTEPAAIAADLKAHWEKTFQKGDINEEKVAMWLQQALADHRFAKLDGRTDRWQVRQKDSVWAKRTAKASAPGPDGIAAGHWRVLGCLVADALHEVAATLEHESAEEEIRRAYSDEEGGAKSFKLGIL